MISAYLRLYLKLFLLRIGPQDIPHSRSLVWLTLVLVLGLSLIEDALVLAPMQNLAINLFNLGFFVLFLYCCLRLSGKSARFPQTLAAACGVGILFCLLELPPYWLLVSEKLPDIGMVTTLAIVYFRLLLVYNIIVLGHIFRHALSTSMLFGFLVTLAYLVLNLLIINAVFPVKN